MKFILIYCFLVLISCNIDNDHKNNGNKETIIKDLYKYDIEKRLDEMGVKLPVLNKPVANYVHAVKTGNLVFLAGKGPRDSHGNVVVGKVGKDVTVEEAYALARNVAITQLSALKNEIGDLNKVVRIVKVLGMVNATDNFGRHSEVINGFSDVIVEVFGERGKHARAAVGMGSLPRNMVCEIEMIIEVQN